MEKIGDIMHNYLAEKVEVRFSSLDFRVFKEKKVSVADPPLKFDTDRPELNASSMIESKEIIKGCQVVPSRYKKPLVSNINMQLTSERIKLYKTEKILASARKKMDISRRGAIQQWKDLEKKEDALRTSFIHFNKFVRENHEKKGRAMKKIEDDRKLIAKRTIELNNLIELSNKTAETTKEMDAKIHKYRAFTMFLKQVMDEFQEFHTINDIIDRYYELIWAKDWLLHDQKSHMSFLENAQSDMMKLIEEKNFVIMGLNNQIANLQARYENANIKALESEELVTEIKNNAVKQQSEIDIVKTSIWNVYVHMASSKKHPVKIKKDNVEEQMMYINRTLTELTKVNKLIKKKSPKK